MTFSLLIWQQIGQITCEKTLRHRYKPPAQKPSIDIDTEIRKRRVFMVLFGIGLVIGLAVHLSTFIMTGVSRLIPLYLMLPILVLGLLEPASESDITETKPIRSIKLLTQTWSDQARTILYGLEIYFVVTLLFDSFVLNLGGITTIHDGQYMLWNHGFVIKQLTAQEFNWHVTFELRWLSIIPLVGYYYSMMKTYFDIAHLENERQSKAEV